MIQINEELCLSMQVTRLNVIKKKEPHFDRSSKESIHMNPL